MNINRSTIVRIFLILFAVGVVSFVLVFGNVLVSQLKEDQEAKISSWADATRLLASDQMNESDVMLFLLSIVQENNTIPVIVTDADDHIMFFRNLTETDSLSDEALREKFIEMKEVGRRIDIDLENDEQQHLYYSNSRIINLLEYYPFVQITLVALLIIFAYIIFSRANRYEQNQVWIGLARETAHQLGTPITALLGWKDLLATDEEIDKKSIATEIGNDINRLQAIADRFSKISSSPEMKGTNLIPEIESVINYLKNRAGKNTSFELTVQPGYDLKPLHNKILISWAIENIIKNAIDAMPNGGKISVNIKKSRNKTIIDITDTGKGMTKSQARRIFRPGFTTKTRGWGIGLTLTKRIINQYHKGKIMVKNTQINVGTTIRIILRK